jgi:hypothetical protein
LRHAPLFNTYDRRSEDHPLPSSPHSIITSIITISPTSSSNLLIRSVEYHLSRLSTQTTHLHTLSLSITTTSQACLLYLLSEAVAC